MMGFVVFLMLDLGIGAAAAQRPVECSNDEVVSLLSQSLRPKHVAQERHVVGNFSWDEVTRRLKKAGATIERTAAAADEVGQAIAEAGVEINAALHHMADAVDLIADGGLDVEIKAAAAAAKLTLLYLKERHFSSSAKEAFRLLRALGAVAKTLRKDLLEYKRVGNALTQSMKAITMAAEKIKEAIEIQERYRLPAEMAMDRQVVDQEMPTLHGLAQKLRGWGVDLENTTFSIGKVGAALGVAGPTINLAFQLIANNTKDITNDDIAKLTQDVKKLVAVAKDIIKATEEGDSSTVTIVILSDFEVLAQIFQDVKAFFADMSGVKDGLTLVVEALKKLVIGLKCHACTHEQEGIVYSSCRCKGAPTIAPTNDRTLPTSASTPAPW